MEGHFSVVWCNFRVKDEFNRKILTDTKKISDLNEKDDISKISAIFRRNCKPWVQLHPPRASQNATRKPTQKLTKLQNR